MILPSLDEAAKTTNANIDGNSTEPVTEPLAATLFISDDPQVSILKSEMAGTATSVFGDEPSLLRLRISLLLHLRKRSE